MSSDSDSGSGYVRVGVACRADTMDDEGSSDDDGSAAVATAAAADAATAAAAATAAVAAAATSAAAAAAAAAAVTTSPRGKKRSSPVPEKADEDTDADGDGDADSEGDGDTSASDAGAASAAASAVTKSVTGPKKKKPRVLSDIISTTRNGRGAAAKKMRNGAGMFALRRGCAVALTFGLPLDKDNQAGRLTSRMVSGSLTKPGPDGTTVQESITATLGPVLAAIAPEIDLPGEFHDLNVGDIALVAMHMQARKALGSVIPDQAFYDAMKPAIRSDTLVPGGKRRRTRNAVIATASYIDDHDLSDVDEDDHTARGLERRILLPGTRRLLAKARKSHDWFGGYPATGSITLDKKTGLYRFIVRVRDTIRVNATAPTMAAAAELRRKYAAENDRLLNIWRVWPDDPRGNTIQMVIRMPAAKMTFVSAESGETSCVSVAALTAEELEDPLKSVKTLVFDSSYLDTVCTYVWTNWPSQQTHCTPTNPAGECRGKVSGEKKTSPLGIMKHMSGMATRLEVTSVFTDTSNYKVRDYRISNWAEPTDAGAGAAAASQ